MRGGAAPRPLHSSPYGGAPPLHPGGFCGTASPCTHLQALRESMAKPCSAPRVTFPTREKSPKAHQGLRPLESPWVSAKLWEPDTVRFEGWNAKPIELKAITIPYRPFRARCAALRLAPGYLLPQNKTDLPLWGCGQIGLVFFLKLYRGHTLYFQSVARQGCPRGCRRFYTPATPLGQGAGESKGVRPLVPGVQGPGGPWRIFRSIYAAAFLYARK